MLLGGDDSIQARTEDGWTEDGGDGGWREGKGGYVEPGPLLTFKEQDPTGSDQDEEPGHAKLEDIQKFAGSRSVELCTDCSGP
eukprot:753449-Hanusia_phi.AAC.2